MAFHPTTPVRYVLLQVPAALVVLAMVVCATRFGWITPRFATAAFVLWIAKDVLLYPLVHRAYSTDDREYHKHLIGRTGRAREDLAPSGYVTIAGELWRARVALEETPIRAGESVIVCGVDDAKVVVRRSQGTDTVRST